MTIECLYAGERVEEFLIKVEAHDRKLLSYWDYYANNNAAFLVDIKKKGFTRTGVKEKVEYFGSTFAIVKVFND